MREVMHGIGDTHFAPAPRVRSSTIPNYQLGWLGGMGQDNLPGDLSVTDVTTATQAFNSGALSASGYNQIMSGNVASASLSDFIAADPGAPVTPLASTTNWLTQNSIISSVPNWLIAGIVVLLIVKKK